MTKENLIGFICSLFLTALSLGFAYSTDSLLLMVFIVFSGAFTCMLSLTWEKGDKRW